MLGHNEQGAGRTTEGDTGQGANHVGLCKPVQGDLVFEFDSKASHWCIPSDLGFIRISGCFVLDRLESQGWKLGSP